MNKYLLLSSIKMDLRDRNELISMCEDFIKYGYRFNFLKTYDYPQYAIEKYGEVELKKCWDYAFESVCNM